MSDPVKLSRPLQIAILALLLSLAAVLSFEYYMNVSKPFLPDRIDLHTAILDGEAPSPYRYRVLVPAVGALLWWAFGNVTSSVQAFVLAYWLLDFAALAGFLVLLFVYVKRWFTWQTSLLGVFFCAGMLPLTFHEHYFQPWSLWEAVFFTAALILIADKRFYLFGVIVALATLNRETAIFLPLLFLLTTQEGVDPFKQLWRINRKELAWFLTYLLIWGVIFAGARALRGPSPHLESLASILKSNLLPKHLFKSVVYWSLFLGAFWFFVVTGYRNAPSLVRRSAWIIPPYVLVLAVWSYWFEVRLLAPLLPVLLPLGLTAFTRLTTAGEQPLQQ